jgi:hypothetical protein
VKAQKGGRKSFLISASGLGSGRSPKRIFNRSSGFGISGQSDSSERAMATPDIKMRHGQAVEQTDRSKPPIYSLLIQSLYLVDGEQLPSSSGGPKPWLDRVHCREEPGADER